MKSPGTEYHPVFLYSPSFSPPSSLSPIRLASSLFLPQSMIFHITGINILHLIMEIPSSKLFSGLP